MSKPFNSPHQELQHADALFNEGLTLFRKNQTGDYYDLFAQVANIYFKHEEWAKYFECQLSIAVWHQHQNQLTKAQIIIEELLLLYEQKIGEPSITKYRLLSALAMMYAIQKQHQKSKEFYQKSLSTAKKLKVFKAIAHSYNGLGSVCMHVYKYHEALSYYFKAAKIEKTHGNEDGDIYKLVHQNIAYSYFMLGQYELAKYYFQKTLYLFEKGDKTHYYHVSTIKSVLGRIADKEGLYTQSANYYQEALEIKQTYNLKDTDYAILLARRGLLHIKQKDWEKGEADLEAAIALQNTFDFKNHEWFYFCYMDYTRLYIDERQWDKALHYLEEAQKSNAHLSLTKNYGAADIYFHFALLFEKKGELEKALKYTQKAVKYWNKGFRLHSIKEKKLLFQIRSTQINIYRTLYYAKREERYLFATNQLLSELYMLIEEIAIKMFQEKDQIKFNQQARQLYNNLIYLLYEHYLLTLEEEILEEIFVLFEKSKVNSLLASFQNAEALESTDIPIEKITQLQSLQSQIVSAEKKLNSIIVNTSNNLQNEAAEELIELQIDYHQFVQALEKEYPNYLYTKNQLPGIDIDELQELLKSNTAIVEYEITDSFIYIFCLTDSESTIIRQLLPADFHQQINHLIDEGILGLNRKKYVQAAYHLYETLFKPIVSFLQQNLVKHLHFIPDIHLLELPFEALLTAPIDYKSSYTHFPYLLQEYTIQYHYSATLWAYQQKRIKNTSQFQEEFLGYAPVYSNDHTETLATVVEATRAVNIGGVDYQALLYSEQEVQDIQASFESLGKTSNIHLRTAATLNHFKEKLSNSTAKYLHIAAHSVLGNEEEELVGILFSPPIDIDSTFSTTSNGKFTKRSAVNSNNVDSVLYPNEVAQLPLKSDLVFLSCCKSGIGKLVEGEGMLSINRSFLSAGVSNIVFTLFKIYDSKTPLLTQHFYEAILKDGKSYSEALQYAKKQMIKMGIAPKFWSGFLLLGA